MVCLEYFYDFSRGFWHTLTFPKIKNISRYLQLHAFPDHQVQGPILSPGWKAKSRILIENCPTERVIDQIIYQQFRLSSQVAITATSFGQAITWPFDFEEPK